MSEWQDISAAPKDGTRVLLWFVAPWSPRAVVGHWQEDRYASLPRPYWTRDDERIAGLRAVRSNQPTHWMPLPDAPQIPSGFER